MTLSTAAPPQPVSRSEHPRPHIAALDGLRGLAVVAVLFFHAGKLQGGFLGVDLFFALSGFLITSLLLAEVEARGRVDVVAFWGRRFRRLLPAVLLLLVAVTIVTTIVASVPERAATLSDGPWAQAYVANWHAIAGHRDYWASFDLPRMFGHLWSLAIEEQFYLIWPVVVALIAVRSRHAHRVVMIVCVGTSLLSLGLMIALFDPADPTTGVHRYRHACQQPAPRGAVRRGADAQGRAHPRLATGRGVLHRGRDHRRHHRDLVVPDRRTVVGVVVPRRPVRSLVVFGRAGGRLRVTSFCNDIALARLGTVAGDRRAVVQPLSLALADVRPAVRTAHRPVGLDVAAVASCRIVCGGGDLQGCRRGPCPIPGHVGAGPPRNGDVDRRLGRRCRVLGRGTAPTHRPCCLLDRPARVDNGGHPCADNGCRGLDRFPRGRTEAGVDTRHTTIAPTTTTEALLAPTTRVLLVGDSIAFDVWPAVAAAMLAGNISIGGYVSPGAGLLDTLYDSSTEIGDKVVDFKPDLVLYQGSLWDTGTPGAQRVAYQQFTDMVLGQGSRLAFITIPPLRADHQDPGHLGALTGIMHEIADEHPGQVIVLDSDEVWGPVFTQDVNGDKVPERKPDGVHVCPSGAAMYAVWLTDQLQQRFADFVPAPLAQWATGDWIDDPRYTQPEGICAALP